MTLDPQWPVLGRSGNATFLLADPRIIVVAPDEGCTDVESTARASIGFQQAHWRSQGHSGAGVVLMDRLAHQTKEARRVYQLEVDASLITGFGLVSSSVFGRAAASVFMGLARLAVPTRMFGTLSQAIQWLKTHHEDGDAA